MKQTLSILLGVALAATAFGGDSLKELTLTLSTQGPDRYADGSDVKTGETYLLVYVHAGATNAGVRTDGTLVNPLDNEIATTGAAIDGYRCGFKAIQYPASLYPPEGKWALVLLDTRDANGNVGGLVVGQSEVTAGVNLRSAANNNGPIGMDVKAQSGLGLTSAGETAVSLGTKPPVIASVARNGNKVDIKIKDFTDTASYEVQDCTDLALNDWQNMGGKTGMRLQARTLGVTPGPGQELPATVTVQDDDTVRFFRVIGK
jgi:hypothetical protein